MGITKSSSKLKIKKVTKKYTKYKTNFKMKPPFPAKLFHKHNLNFKYTFKNSAITNNRNAFYHYCNCTKMIVDCYFKSRYV